MCPYRNEAESDRTRRPSRALTSTPPPDYVAGHGLSDTPTTGNTPAGHITQPST
jgi:hypothetical protein